MYENLKNTVIDKTKEEYRDFPDFLHGHLFLDYDNGWITQAPVEEPEIQVVPQVISLRQAREVLIRRDLFEQVQSYIESIEDPTQKAIILNYWEYSTVFERSNPTILQMAGMLGFSSEQLDEFFTEASKL